MELLKTDLHRMIGHDGLPAEVTATMLKHVTSGLRYLHLKDLVHRDIKPGNIFVSAGVAKIGDFGLCCRKRQAKNTLGVCGTLQYLPADILTMRTPMGERRDIWGLGCVLCLGFLLALFVLCMFFVVFVLCFFCLTCSRYEMVEATLAFEEPPKMEQPLPEMKSPKWRTYGSVLHTAWKQLMSTPTAVQSLEIVGDLASCYLLVFQVRLLLFSFFKLL